MLFKRNHHDKRDVAIGLDLGASQLKAVVVQRDNQTFKLIDFAVAPTAIPRGKPGGDQQLAAELQQLLSNLRVSDRRVNAVVNCQSAMVCEVELPRMPVGEVCAALKLNSARYLRRDVSQYYLDACELPQPETESKMKKLAAMRVLVGGAQKTEVVWYRDALAAAKIRTEILELAPVAVLNAFRLGHTAVCAKETVLLLDVGANQTSINFLRNGTPALTRLMQFGGHQISEYLAQVLTLDSTAAEEEKIKLSATVLPLVKTAVLPLAKEVRSSIDFFERQQECHVTRMFACGGTACAPTMLEFLSEFVGSPIEQWNPLENFDITAVNGATPQLLAVAPTLAAAVGAALPRLR